MAADRPRDLAGLLWALANVPVSAVLGLTPAALLVIGVWTLALDGGALLFGWWSTAPPGFGGQVILLSALPLGVIAGPRVLKAHAQVASSLLAPTREEMAALVGLLVRVPLPGGGLLSGRTAPDRT